MTSGSPSRHCPAAASRPMTSRTWAAVTSVASSAGPRRTAFQRQRPRRPARFQGHDPRVGPAGDELRVALPAGVAVAEQPLRAGHRLRPQPVAHVAGQPDPPVVPLAQRDARQRLAQPADPDLAAVHRVIDAPVAPAAFRLQAQLRQHVHPLRPAREGVARLEQGVPAQPERAVQLIPEPRQQPRTTIRPVRAIAPGHNEGHGHRLGVFKFCGRNPKIIKRWPPHVTTTRRTQ